MRSRPRAWEISWKLQLEKHQIGGWRGASAALLQGQGSSKRSCFLRSTVHLVLKLSKPCCRRDRKASFGPRIMRNKTKTCQRLHTASRARSAVRTKIKIRKHISGFDSEIRCARQAPGPASRAGGPGFEPERPRIAAPWRERRLRPMVDV